MKLIAIHRIEGKKVVLPGAQFERSAKAGERLIKLGAARRVEGDVDEPEKEKKEPGAKK